MCKKYGGNVIYPHWRILQKGGFLFLYSSVLITTSVTLQPDIKKRQCNFSTENRSQKMTLNHPYTSKARIEVFQRKHLCKVQWFPSKNTTVFTSQVTACSLSSWQCLLILHDGLQEVIIERRMYKGDRGPALASNSTPLFNAMCMAVPGMCTGRWCCMDMERTAWVWNIWGWWSGHFELQCHCFPHTLGCVWLPQQAPSAECQEGQCHPAALTLDLDHLSQLVPPSRPASHPPGLPQLSPQWCME